MCMVWCSVTYLHGHRRPGYYRLRNFKLQAAAAPGQPYFDLLSRAVEVGEVQILGCARPPPPSASSSSLPSTSGNSSMVTAAASSVAGSAAAAVTTTTTTTTQLGLLGSAGLGAMLSPMMMMAGAGHGGAVAGSGSGGGGGSGSEGVPPFRVLRLMATGCQEDHVHKICIRGVKVS